MKHPNLKKVDKPIIEKIISRLVSVLIITTIIWGLLVYYVEFSVKWEQVLGVFMIFIIITEYIMDRVYMDRVYYHHDNYRE